MLERPLRAVVAVVALLAAIVVLAPAPAGANGLSCPTDDEREDDDTPATATELEVQVGLSPPTGPTGVLCDDADWFRLRAPGAALTATLSFSHAQSDLELDLYRQDGGSLTLVDISTGVTDTEQVSATLAEATYYLRVRTAGGQGAYTLFVTASVCPPDDPLEPDDTPAQATVVGSGTTHLNLCDTDHLAVELARGDRLSVSVAVNGFGAAPTLAVRTPSGGAPNSFGVPSGSFDLIALETGTFVLAASPGSGAPALLAVTLDITEGCDAGFSDVPPTAVLCPEIAAAALVGLTTGNADGTFAPTRPVRRGEMAAFLVRLLNATDGSTTPPGPATPTFPDVPTTHVFYDEIEALVTAGVATGRADGTYDPAGTLNRQELAAFVFRLNDDAFTPPATPTFTNVPTGSPFFAAVEYLAGRGIVTGYGDGRFGPTDPITRQAMAAILVRTIAAQ